VDIGIAFDLKSDFAPPSGGESPAAASGPDDLLEEYDSERTIDGIAAVLAKRGHTARRLGSGRRFLEAVLRAPPDLVFNVAEGSGSRSREAHVPAVCEMLRIPCTHSDPLTLAVALDKGMAKRVVASAGVATPRFAVVESIAEAQRLDLAFPLIAKPLFEGSSMGVRTGSKCDDRGALERQLARLLGDYRQPALIEEFCTGAEFTVGLLGSGAGARPIGVMEIVPLKGGTENFVYSVEVKRIWSEEIAYHVPPQRPRELIVALERTALAAYRALECRDVGRVDLRIGRDGEPKFIEINPLPGVNPGWSDLCVLGEKAGLSYDDLIGGILDAALARLKLA
jgi:D-alanine-D-alanine ligase